MSYIYVITNNINNKKYVGKTNFSIEKRFKEHKRDSKKRKLEKRPLYSAMRKYGEENFSIEELEECASEKAEEREIYWINKLNTYGHNGYNATHGGDGKQLYNYKEIADKYLEFLSIDKTSKFFNCDPSIVRKACEENNIEIINYYFENIKKSVIMLDKDNNQVIKIFKGISNAARWICEQQNKEYAHYCTAHINEVIKGKRKTAYEHKWKLAE